MVLDVSREFFRALWEYNHGKTYLSTTPQISCLEITNKCNFNCVYCARETVYKHRGFGSMSYEDYAMILYKYPRSIRHLRLFLHGEPTLHSDLTRMIALAKAQGSKTIGFTTNGQLATKEKFTEWVHAGLTVISFSFDGPPKELFEKTRRGGDYDVIWKNILDCCKAKKHYGWHNVTINLNVVQTALSKPYLAKFFYLCHTIGGINHIEVTSCGDWMGEVNVEGLQLPKQPCKVQNVCSAAWHGVVIQYNGWVVPCCRWLWEPMGNIFEDDLMTIWNNGKFVQFRETMKRGRKSHPYCYKCLGNPFMSPKILNQEPNPLFPFDFGFIDFAIGKCMRAV